MKNTYAEFHYWKIHDLTKLRGYIVDSTHTSLPEVEFKKELLESIIVGFKTIYPNMIICEHIY